jgi:hypothetical protein
MPYIYKIAGSPMHVPFSLSSKITSIHIINATICGNLEFDKGLFMSSLRFKANTQHSR